VVKPSACQLHLPPRGTGWVGAGRGVKEIRPTLKVRLPHEEDPFRAEDVSLVRTWRVGNWHYVELRHLPIGLVAEGSDRRRNRAHLDGLKELATGG